MRHFLLVIAVMFSITTTAQTPVEKVLRQYASLAGPHLNYDYKVSLVDLASNQVVDSIVGKLYRQGRHYADSNNQSMTVVHNNYYCKVDHDRKKVTVYDITFLQRKLGLKLADVSPGGLQISDSFALKQGTLRVDSNVQNQYLVSWRVEGMPNTAFLLTIRKSDYTIKEFTMEHTEYDGEKAVFLRRYRINNISHVVPVAVFDLSRFFAKSNNGVVLTSKYSGYILKSLSN